jgi:exopolyphosphatase/guanosine-5'-triphosphate,3'-diphosphate pyrophosphatase
MSVSPLYAVIDLGSNSFHMLITRLLADSVQTVDKVKRKVRLASGLNNQNILSEEAISRGLECLSFFAERLQDIPIENIKVVATATLRIAKNADDFLIQAEKILGHNINLLSGIDEAKTIYLGVAHTSSCEAKRLVIDIGGASTELIIGEEFDAKKVQSLDLGCVTFNQQYFSCGLLTQNNFSQAIDAAKKILAPEVLAYKELGWHSVLGGSGTMQALTEVLMSRHQPAIINKTFLHQFKAQLMACKTIDNIDINGLQAERKPVIASGVAILIAIFESFDIEQLQLSSGALREGLLYEMLPDMQNQMIRIRTIHSLAERFHIDQQHSLRLAAQMDILFDLLADQWQLERDNSYQLLMAGCALHEIGLLLAYKYHQQHGAYILQHADLPGFDQADRQLLVALVKNYKIDIDITVLEEQAAVCFSKACYLLVILRIAVILCRRRQDDVLPPFTVQATESSVTLTLSQSWLSEHPLIEDELKQENIYWQKLGLILKIQ